MRAQTQAAQWLQGEFDSFDTTGLPFTPLVNFNHNFGIWGASLQLSKVKRTHSSEDGYGTGDQVLYSPKLSQACEVDPAGPTGQGP